MVVCDSVWLRMVVCGYFLFLRLYLFVCGCVWQCVVVCDCVWLCSVVCDCV